MEYLWLKIHVCIPLQIVWYILSFDHFLLTLLVRLLRCMYASLMLLVAILNYHALLTNGKQVKVLKFYCSLT